MGTIIIHRPNELINSLLKYDIYIDGKKVASIAKGETKEFTLSPQAHTIQTKVDWCTSQRLLLDVTNNQERHLQTSGFKFFSWVMVVSFVLNVLISTFFVRFYKYYLFYISIPVFLIVLYFLTIEKKRYLNLTEIAF